MGTKAHLYTQRDNDLLKEVKLIITDTLEGEPSAKKSTADTATKVVTSAGSGHTSRSQLSCKPPKKIMLQIRQNF